MSHRKIGEIFTRELFVIGVPTLFIVLLVFGITYYFVLPAPPRTLVMTTGMEGVLPVSLRRGGTGPRRD